MKTRGNDPSRVLRPTRTSHGERASGAGAAAKIERETAAGASQATRAGAPALQPIEARSAGAKQALRALAMDVRSPERREENAGAEAATFGARLLDVVRSKTFRRASAAACLGLSLLGTVQKAHADTIFLDFNNGVKEIETARQLAAEKGEKFVLVRPTAEAIEQVFAKAERGEIDLRHLILSGHSGGTSVWGSGPNGERFSADIDLFRDLKKKYPNAFAQVEHVNFMACYAGGEGNSAAWNEVFNNARAIVGFYGSGPASDRPASSWVLRNVERELRRLPDTTLSPQNALLRAKRIANLDGPRHTKFGIRLDGVYYKAGQQTTSADLVMQRVQFNRNQTFLPYFEAQPGRESPPTNHQSSPLRDYYNQLQDAVNHVAPGTSEAEQLQSEVRTTIRLIYFDNVVKNVQLEHGDTFAQANEQLRQLGAGFEIPSELETKSRAELLQIGEQLSGVRDADLHLFLRGQAGTVDQVNAFFSSRGIDFRFELPPASASSWEAERAVNDLDQALSQTYFTQAEKELVDVLGDTLLEMRRMSNGEREQAAVRDAAEVLTASGVGSLLEQAQSRVEVPRTVEEAERLGLDGMRQLARALRQEATGLDSWHQRTVTDVAGQIDQLLGTSGRYDESLAVSRVLRRHEADVANLNAKLEALGARGRITAGDKLGRTADDLSELLRELDRFEAPPMALFDAVSALHDGVRAPPSTAVGAASRVFQDAIRDLKPGAVPDNWITD